MGFWTSKILLWLFAVSLVIGAVDSFRGNPWRLGERFSAGIRAFEPLFLTMAGIIVLVPLMQRLLVPTVAPLLNWCGIDPSLSAGLFLACDMGGYPLAHSLTTAKTAADFSGMLTASVIGTNVVFTLPAAIKMVQKEDYPYLFKGILLGVITAPVGCFFGGIVLGCPILPLLRMLLPILLFSSLAALLLFLIPETAVKILSLFGRTVEGIALLGLTAAIVVELTGISCRPYLELIQTGIVTVGSIIIVLPGAYVFIALLDKALHSRFLKIGKMLGINDVAALGLVTSLANSIPTFAMVKEMDPKGKMMNFAFLTAGAFAFGDHLAYCCAVAPELALPLLVTKLTGAISAVLLLLIINAWSKRERRDKNSA